MKKKIQIICTLGPSSLNSKFLDYADKNVDLLRLNMSHLNISDLEKNIKFIKKKTSCPICIDTEGAQIRSKFKKKIFLKKKALIYFRKDGNKTLGLYPEYVQDRLKLNDILNIGFEGLKVKIIKKNHQFLQAKVINEGYFEGNKGVHLENRRIKLKCLTEKDIEAIKVGKLHNINNFALSFTNSLDDVKYFNELNGQKANNIFKIETKQSINEFTKIIKEGSNFLIDRGDLSKDIGVYKIPETQRKLINIKNRLKSKKIYNKLK